MLLVCRTNPAIQKMDSKHRSRSSTGNGSSSAAAAAAAAGATATTAIAVLDASVAPREPVSDDAYLLPDWFIQTKRPESYSESSAAAASHKQSETETLAIGSFEVEMKLAFRSYNEFEKCQSLDGVWSLVPEQKHVPNGGLFWREKKQVFPFTAGTFLSFTGSITLAVSRVQFCSTEYKFETKSGSTVLAPVRVRFTASVRREGLSQPQTIHPNKLRSYLFLQKHLFDRLTTTAGTASAAATASSVVGRCGIVGCNRHPPLKDRCDPAPIEQLFKLPRLFQDVSISSTENVAPFQVPGFNSSHALLPHQIVTVEYALRREAESRSGVVTFHGVWKQLTGQAASGSVNLWWNRASGQLQAAAPALEASAEGVIAGDPVCVFVLVARFRVCG